MLTRVQVDFKKEIEMFRIAVFILLIAFLAVNFALQIHGDGLKVYETLSADGWTRECTYYRPMQFVTKRLYVSDQCDRQVHFD